MLNENSNSKQWPAIVVMGVYTATLIMTLYVFWNAVPLTRDPLEAGAMAFAIMMALFAWPTVKAVELLYKTEPSKLSTICIQLVWSLYGTIVLSYLLRCADIVFRSSYILGVIMLSCIAAVLVWKLYPISKVATQEVSTQS